MSLVFRFTEQLTNRYSDEIISSIIEELSDTMYETLEMYSVQHQEFVCNGTGVYIESDSTLNVWDTAIEGLLEYLDQTLNNAEITDIAVYYKVSYYGIAVDYEYWDGELPSEGVETEEQESGQIQFELVAKQDLMPFLDPNAPLSTAYQSPVAVRALDAFRKDGIWGTDFMQIKSDFLKTLETTWFYLSLDQVELAENIGISNWYKIQIYQFSSNDQSQDFREFRQWKYGYAPNGKGFLCSYDFLDENTQEVLQDLYTIAPCGDVGEDQTLSLIQPYTEFEKVEIYNVGQALCAGIFRSFSYEEQTQEQLAAFFDFGIPHTAGRPRPRAAADYQTILNEINTFVNKGVCGYETRDRIHIVLSHWHLDHCILALCLKTELAHTIWYVPAEGLGSSAQKIHSHIVSHGGKVNTVTYPFNDLTINGNINLHLGKIDYGVKCDPNPQEVRASRHPHHHGMYLIVNLKSGNNVFLSGDCTYAGINKKIRENKFEYLQASHHGGNYALPPASRSLNDIPLPSMNADKVIYSCGPYSEQHHPSQTIISDHHQAGWTGIHNTHIHNGYTLR